MTFNDLVVTTVMAAAAAMLLSARIRSLPRPEAQVATLSFVVHLLASFVGLAVVDSLYAGGADFYSFRRFGGLIAEEMRRDFFEVFPRAILLFFHRDAYINVPMNLDPRGGRSTLSMWILEAMGDLVFFRSFTATFAAYALFSFSGKLALVSTFREYFPERRRVAVGASILLVPSVVYWTSGLIKEGIAVGALGFAIWGLERLGRRRSVDGLPAAIFGLVLLSMIKPYLLMPLASGGAAWLYSLRSRGPDGYVRIRPAWLVATAAASVVAVLLVGRVFPQFSLDSLGEESAKLQFYGQRAGGGSTYALGPATATFAGQLRFAPVAVFTALFRPLILEANSPQVLVNALETSAILGATLWLLFRKRWASILATVMSNPALAFSVAFTLPLALGVGLISSNLGTLSRYRSPLVPFLVLTLVALIQAEPNELVGLPKLTAAMSAVRARGRERDRRRMLR